MGTAAESYHFFINSGGKLHSAVSVHHPRQPKTSITISMYADYRRDILLDHHPTLPVSHSDVPVG
jgi:hypothetical protein